MNDSPSPEDDTDSCRVQLVVGATVSRIRGRILRKILTTLTPTGQYLSILFHNSIFDYICSQVNTLFPTLHLLRDVIVSVVLLIRLVHNSDDAGFPFSVRHYPTRHTLAFP